MGRLVRSEDEGGEVTRTGSGRGPPGISAPCSGSSLSHRGSHTSGLESVGLGERGSDISTLLWSRDIRGQKTNYFTPNAVGSSVTLRVGNFLRQKGLRCVGKVHPGLHTCRPDSRLSFGQDRGEGCSSTSTETTVTATVTEPATSSHRVPSDVSSPEVFLWSSVSHVGRPEPRTRLLGKYPGRSTWSRVDGGMV